MPSQDRGLLARLVALALLPGGRLAAADARVAARATGLTLPGRSGGPAPGQTHREAVELLRAVAEGSGCCGYVATGWRRLACATPGPRSIRVCGPA